MTYVPAPKTLEAFPKAKRVKPKTPLQGGGGLRSRWEDEECIYEWDYRHGLVEKYDKRGNHLGEFEPIKGERIKPGVATRKLS